MATILTIDDDEKIRALLQVLLTRRGHQVRTASSGSEALAVFQRERPLITILDLQMPDINGLSILQQIREWDSAALVIILTGVDTAQLEPDARRLGAAEVLQKGFSLHAIGDTVSRVLAQANPATLAPSPTGADTAQLKPDARRRRGTEVLQKGSSSHAIDDTVSRVPAQANPATLAPSPTGADTAPLEPDAQRRRGTEVLQKGSSPHAIDNTVSRVPAQANPVTTVPSPRESHQAAIPHDNRRKHPRIAVHLQAALSKGGAIIADAEVVDLSTEGCALSTGATIEQEDYLQMYLMLSTHVAYLPLTIELAVVRWVHQPMCGLEFLILTPSNQDRLRQHVTELQDQMPQPAASVGSVP